MANEPAPAVAAACDGACSGNPGPGGWGALIRFADGSVREYGGHEAATTNNRMELTAALALLQELRQLPRRGELVIRTDSRYLIDGLQSWIHGWKRRGWRTASGSAVLNRDLWEQLDAARLADVRFEHVRGHSGDPDNERCDAIAVAHARGQEAPTAAAQAADLAPAPLQQLLTRLELAGRLAQGGYSLTLVELAQLLEQPAAQLAERQDPWRWRDWRVEPLAEGRWRLVAAPPAAQHGDG
ncbi:MAG: ribonuclease HI [Cyanobacteria bacterium M_surface_9_m1_291]|nr:ribonuclease HI [Cyanobacteria bacterium K_Offshore_0m_m2_072]MBM5809812.1 ribonuclease HI [Cyanobacteria bacterium M_surface_9_m1_291]